MKKIRIDVSTLIKKLEKRNVTFYPVIMYILLVCIKAKEDDVFFQMPENLCLKTKFNKNFEAFYQNYVKDCYESKHQKDIKEGKIFFALKPNTKADFELYPLEKKEEKTFLKICANFNPDSDFERILLKVCADF